MPKSFSSPPWRRPRPRSAPPFWTKPVPGTSPCIVKWSASSPRTRRLAPSWNAPSSNPRTWLRLPGARCRVRVRSQPTSTRRSIGPESRSSSTSLAPSAQQADSLGRLGHYEVLEVVGHGGMGIVMRAFDEKLHRVIAIKALAPALATSARGPWAVRAGGPGRRGGHPRRERRCYAVEDDEAVPAYPRDAVYPRSCTRTSRRSTVMGRCV